MKCPKCGFEEEMKVKYCETFEIANALLHNLEKKTFAGSYSSATSQQKNNDRLLHTCENCGYKEITMCEDAKKQ